ncbi:glycosyltransferase family 9 protein [Candidatus Neomarinimicrobiota bacterium]
MNRVLVIRFSSLGDIILTSPVIEGLKKVYPGVHIDYLVHRRFGSIVKRFATLPDNIIEFSEGLAVTDLPQYVRDLSPDGYDLVIDLHDSLRSKIIRKLVDCSELRIYRKPHFNRWLLFKLHINRFPNDFSVAGSYLEFAGLKGHNIDPKPKMYVTEAIVDTVTKKYGLQNPYTVCIPGAAWPQKSWPVEKYIELFGNRTADQRRVVLVGGAEDSICDQIAGNLEHSRVLNLRGQSDLDEALAIIAGSAGAIGADTGLMHAAEALGKRVVLILGPTSKETGAGVHLENSVQHENMLWCRPCSQNGKRPCYRKQQYCMTKTSTAAVSGSLGKLELD